MLQDAKNRRTEDRRSPSIYVGVITGTDGEIRGRISDLSPCGAQLIAAFRMTPGDAVTMRIESVIPGCEPLELPAECRWSHESVLPGYFDNGLIFDTADDALRAEIVRRIRAATI